MILDAIQASELDLIIRFQGAPAPLWLMKSFSNLGPSNYLLGAIGIIYLSWSTPLGARLALAYFSSQAVSSLAKLVVHAPRPFWVDSRIHGFEPDLSSYGFPSGHALVGTTVWLLAALVVRRSWFWGMALMAILLICASRVWLGSHFISDVVGGSFMGLAFVALFLRLESPGMEAWVRWSLPKKCTVVVALSLSVVAMSALMQTWVSSTPHPAAWADYAVKGSSLRSSWSCAGAILGMGLGSAMSAQAPPFSAAGPIWQRAARLALVSAPGVLYWFRPQGLMKTLPDWGESAVLFVAATFAAWAFIFALPQLFLRIGLAGNSAKNEVASQKNQKPADKNLAGSKKG